MASWWDNLTNSFSTIGDNALQYITSPQGVVGLLGAAGSLVANATGMNDPVIPQSGYQGGIPALKAVRREVPLMQGQELADGSVRAMGSPAPSGLEALYAAQPTGRMVDMYYDPNRRPGSGGRRYFTDTQYVRDAESVAGAQQRDEEQAAQLAERNIRNPAREMRSAAPAQMATGGVAALKRGKYLDGNTDGMADRVPATIEGKQPAALSDGEFVIPADVVSHLGNGNSDAGAKVLEEMMARVRKARTGRKEQGKQIDARNMLPREVKNG